MAGYPVTEVKPAIGIEAGLSCQLNKFLDIDILLEISRRHDELVDCLLCARPWRPMVSFFSLSKRPTESECAEQFERLLHAINDQLVGRLEADSVSWLTEKEANNLPLPTANVTGKEAT
jgi:hypothetical protein